MATSLGSSLLLKPLDERRHSEGFRQSGARASTCGRRGRGHSGGSSRGDSGRGRGRRHGGSGGAAGAGASAVQSWAGDLVAGVVAAVDVVEDAGVGVLVQGRAEGALGVVGAAAGDLDVQALGVVLGAVLLARAVERDGLVAEDVVAGSERRGDVHGPGVVVGNHLVGRPVVSETGFVNLDPLQGGLVGIGAVAGALGDVGDHGADVRFGPGGPLEINLSTSLHRGRRGGGLGILVADNVGGGIGTGSDEPVVKVLSVPSRGGRGSLALLDLVVVLQVEALGEGAISNDAGDNPMSGSGSRKSNKLEEG